MQYKICFTWLIQDSFHWNENNIFKFVIQSGCKVTNFSE